jgi:hypothetical protein
MEDGSSSLCTVLAWCGRAEREHHHLVNVALLGCRQLPTTATS